MQIPEAIPSDEELVYYLLEDMKYAAQIIGRSASRLDRGEDQIKLIDKGREHTIYEALEKLHYFMSVRIQQMEGLRALRRPIESLEGMARSCDHMVDPDLAVEGS